MPRRNRSIAVLGFVGGALVLLGLLLFGSYSVMGKGWYEGWMARQLVGLSEDLAYMKLGLPERILSREQFEAARRDFQPLPDREVRDKVLVYEEGEQAVLLFVDKDRRIEAVLTVRQASRPGAPPPAATAH